MVLLPSAGSTDITPRVYGKARYFVYVSPRAVWCGKSVVFKFVCVQRNTREQKQSFIGHVYTYCVINTTTMCVLLQYVAQ